MLTRVRVDYRLVVIHAWQNLSKVDTLLGLVEPLCSSTSSPTAAFTAGVVDPRATTREALCNLFNAIEPAISFVPVDSVARLLRRQEWPQVTVAVIHVGGYHICCRWVRRELELAAVAGTKTVALCDSARLSEATNAITLGARGYVTTSFDPRATINAIKMVQEGSIFVPARVLEGDALGIERCAPPVSKDEFHPTTVDMRRQMACLRAGVTAREQVVMELLCTGRPNKIIARDLGIAEGTVKVHVSKLMKKMRVRNRTELCALVKGSRRA